MSPEHAERWNTGVYRAQRLVLASALLLIVWFGVNVPWTRRSEHLRTGRELDRHQGYSFLWDLPRDGVYTLTRPPSRVLVEIQYPRIILSWLAVVAGGSAVVVLLSLTRRHGPDTATPVTVPRAPAPAGSVRSKGDQSPSGIAFGEPRYEVLDLRQAHRLGAASGAIVLPSVWLVLWSQSNATLLDQLLYTIAGTLTVALAGIVLLLVKRPLKLEVAFFVGAVAAVLLRAAVLLAAGQGDQPISGVAFFGGAVGGVTTWLAKTAMTGRYHRTRGRQ